MIHITHLLNINNTVDIRPYVRVSLTSIIVLKILVSLEIACCKPVFYYLYLNDTVL